jgi:hypothetical protein
MTTAQRATITALSAVKLLPKNKNDPFQTDSLPEFLMTSDEQEKIMT